jgi:hypothetical protein
LHKKVLPISRPVEGNFYVQFSDAQIEVTFAPTRSRYIYSRLLDKVDLLSANPVARQARMISAARSASTARV